VACDIVALHTPWPSPSGRKAWDDPGKTTCAYSSATTPSIAPPTSPDHALRQPPSEYADIPTAASFGARGRSGAACSGFSVFARHRSYKLCGSFRVWIRRIYTPEPTHAESLRPAMGNSASRWAPGLQADNRASRHSLSGKVQRVVAYATPERASRVGTGSSSCGFGADT
jgi:hypothetical protein